MIEAANELYLNCDYSKLQDMISSMSASSMKYLGEEWTRLCGVYKVCIAYQMIAYDFSIP